jgi:hypothetical protein
MDIFLTKVSDSQHRVRVRRADASEAVAQLSSRSFLRHDLAHLAVEAELPIVRGYWGSVANGAALDGLSIRGPDILLAESLAGPTQTLMRKDADVATFFAVLNRVRPDLITRELAARIQAHGRQLEGHWRATPYGGEMAVHWHDHRQECGQER